MRHCSGRWRGGADTALQGLILQIYTNEIKEALNQQGIIISRDNYRQFHFKNNQRHHHCIFHLLKHRNAMEYPAPSRSQNNILPKEKFP